MRPINLLQDAIDRANDSSNFKQNKLVATLDVNAFSNEVSIRVNGEVAICVKEKNMTKAYLVLESWLVVAMVSVCRGQSIFVEDGQPKIIAKE